MRYLIITNSAPPFVTHWFDEHNHWNQDTYTAVYDIRQWIWYNGKEWKPINCDHL
jgi:hypothetical protein